jgi:hypothetical protein
MLKRINNENGYALILSLFAIVFISLLGLGLMGSTISTAKQTNQTDSFYRTTHIAEMGIEYTEENVKSYVNNGTVPFTGTTETQVVDYIETMFESIKTKSSNVVIDNEFPSRKYELQEDLDIEVRMDEGVAEVNFDVIGRDGNQEKLLSATISLKGFARSGDGDNGEIDWDDLFPDNPESGWEQEEWDFKNDRYQQYDSNVWVNGDATIKNTDVKVAGNCVFNGNLYSGNGHPDLTICGSAEFNGEVTDTQGQPAFKGNMKIGHHAVFEEKLSLHNGGNSGNRAYLSGGSTHLKNGANVNKLSFAVGQDLIINAQKGTYEFDTTVKVKGDLIIENVEDNENNLRNILNGKFQIGGKVKVYDKNDNLLSVSLGDLGLIISDFDENYTFSEDELTAFIPECQMEQDDGDDGEQGPSDPIIPEVDVVNVNY